MGEAYQINVIRSNRKTISLEIRQDLSVVVRVPNRMPKREIDRFLKEKQEWLERHMDLMRAKTEQRTTSEPFTESEIHQLADLAKKVIPVKVDYYARILGVNYGRITIRNQRTRWGSCSSQGNLNFNCLLMMTPEDVVDYVVVHELCHRLQMNHSKEFWKLVEGIIPDYRIRKKWLSDHGNELICRL